MNAYLVVLSSLLILLRCSNIVQAACEHQGWRGAGFYGCRAGFYCGNKATKKLSTGKCRGLLNIASCKALPDNSYCGWTNGNCIECNPGYYCPNGRNKDRQETCRKNNPTLMEPCPAGTYSGAGIEFEDQCIKCPKGKYGHKEGQGQCEDCEPGWFTDKIGQTNCSACDAGKFSDSPGGALCFECTPGYISGKNASSCEICPKGTQAVKNFTECEICEAGKFAAVEGSPKCQACQPGHTSKAGAETCEPCTEGKYSKSFGGGKCEPCEVGRYTMSTGSYYCLPCQLGRYADVQGSEECKQCPAGKISAESRLSCDDCPAGFYSHDKGQSNCRRCPEGEFSNKGASNCTYCPLGRYNDMKGSSECGPCPVGKFADEVGASVCSLCPKGKFNAQPGMVKCMDCPLGKYVLNKKEGATSEIEGCVNCTAGSFSAETGSVNCEMCPAGKASAIEGSKSKSDCQECKLGYYAEFKGISTCTACPKDTYSNITGSSACRQCPDGMITTRAGGVNCTLTTCDAGSSRDHSTDGSCEACPPGKSASAGEPCMDCKPGFYASERGTPACLPCSAGSFAGAVGSTQCTNCTKGYYAGSIGSTACRVCPPGTFCPYARMSNYNECPEGHYTNVSRQSSCLKCPHGKYQPHIASATCHLCPAGTANSRLGSIRRDDCAPCSKGSYSGSGARECTNCTLGNYQDKAGQAACMSCKSLGSTMTSTADRAGCVVDQGLEGLGLVAQSSVVEALFSKGAAIYGAVIIAVGFTSLAGLLQYKKETNKSKLAVLPRPIVALKSFLPGFTFGSEIFLILGVIEEWPGVGATMLLFRLSHTVVGVAILVALFGPVSMATRFEFIMEGSTTLKKRVDEQYIRENIPFIGMLIVLCLFDVTMLQFMPWKHSKFYTESKGFPCFSVLQVCLVTKALQAFVSAVCQMWFLAANADLSEPTMNAQGKALFILNIVISTLGVVLGLFMLCLKERFLRSVESAEAEEASGEAEAVGMHDLYGSSRGHGDEVVGAVNPLSRPAAAEEAEAGAEAGAEAKAGSGGLDEPANRRASEGGAFTFNPLFGMGMSSSRRGSTASDAGENCNNNSNNNSRDNDSERRISAGAVGLLALNAFRRMSARSEVADAGSGGAAHAPTPRNSITDGGGDHEIDVEEVLGHLEGA